MKLLIISGTPHFVRGEEVVGWGPTVEEIRHLAALFSRVVHIAPLYPGEAPAVMSPYTGDDIEFVPVRPAGGVGWLNKARILLGTPGYVRAMLANLREADAVHVRCPANIALIAIVLLALFRKPKCRWIKYAGEWSPSGTEPISYRFQRWWLRRGFGRSFVTINGTWRAQPPHVRSFRNPSLTDGDILRGRTSGAGKQLTNPMRLLFVGRLTESKGAGRAIETLARVLDAGFEAELELAGDGPDRRRIERLAADLDVISAVRFHGWLDREAVAGLYERSHFLLLPSESEGWPKALSEAMAYGVVPIACDVGGIPQILEQCGLGRCFASGDIDAYAGAIVAYRRDAREWKRHSRLAMTAAPLFTYERYLLDVADLLASVRGASAPGTHGREHALQPVRP